jgi:hypothetical protein
LGVDATGKIYMGGTFGGTCDFDPGPGKHEVTPIGWDIFLLKFNANATFTWVQTWGMGPSDDELATDIFTAPSGDTWICGYFEGTGDFNPGPGVDNHSSLGMQDCWASRFDPNGTFKWARTWGEADDNDVAMAVAPDASGNCYITGFFANTVDFDPGSGTVEIPSWGYYDAFVLELDQNGAYKWAGSIGGTDQDTGQGIAVDSLGNIYIAGQFSGTANLNPGTVQANHVSNGGSDIFLTKITHDHDFTWADAWGGTNFEHLGCDPQYEYGSPLFVDQYGKSYVGGQFGDTVNFNPSGGTDNHTADYYDAFITTVPPNGNW